MRILIADDSKPARMLTVRALKKFDVEILEASDGEQAYEQIKASEIDIVLLDNNMPKMRGIDVLEKLQAEGQSVNAIMISARNDKATIDSAKGFGVLDYVIKPFKMDFLVEKINETLQNLGKSTLS